MDLYLVWFIHMPMCWGVHGLSIFHTLTLLCAFMDTKGSLRICGFKYIPTTVFFYGSIRVVRKLLLDWIINQLLLPSLRFHLKADDSSNIGTNGASDSCNLNYHSFFWKQWHHFVFFLLQIVWMWANSFFFKYSKRESNTLSVSRILLFGVKILTR